ncbi:hemerythrin domain-containing protein [Eikenella sp. S3360]|uniref:Hemerythrin domain-containing protein n=1 Tax=Eikenella glucosivorans TaxID=2766967 RepID=A0ABS0N823_9NEIS|nr:hemerythrin domain-containing protein [Eikenella glucosivorans]MBH5328459.1 hemerythrin domain-containing protein [Eikenella glucosivorans]
MIDRELWQNASDSAIIDHILPRYHDTHRRQLEELLPLAEKVSTVHEGKFPAEVLPLLQAIQGELLSHMMKEERILFPMLKQGAGAAAMPVRMMMHEHAEHNAALERLLEITGNLQAPANACRSWQRLYSLARELVDDLHDHIELEDHILFARVLA